MEYSPRYAQPFTLEEATYFDVAVITEEIARLENSLNHLRETQEGLRDFLKEEADEEISKAFEENQMVIGAQEERISILKMALSEKGVNAGPFHDAKPAAPSIPPPPSDSNPQSQHAETQSAHNGSDTDGVYL